jgi:hypothetical protein
MVWAPDDIFWPKDHLLSLRLHFEVIESIFLYLITVTFGCLRTAYLLHFPIGPSYTNII